MYSFLKYCYEVNEKVMVVRVGIKGGGRKGWGPEMKDWGPEIRIASSKRIREKITITYTGKYTLRGSR